MFQQTCEHLGQMSSVGFLVCKWSQLLIWGIYSLRLTVVCELGKVTGGYKTLVWTSRLGQCLYKCCKKILSVIWLWSYDVTVGASETATFFSLWRKKQSEVQKSVYGLWAAQTQLTFTLIRHSWWHRRFLSAGRKKVCSLNMQKREKSCRRKLSHIMFEWGENKMTRELKVNHILIQSTKQKNKIKHKNRNKNKHKNLFS